MKKLLILLLILSIMGCTGKFDKLRIIMDSGYDFESVYMLEGTSSHFIAVKNGKLYQIRAEGIDSTTITNVYELVPAITNEYSNLPLIIKQEKQQ